MGFCSDRILGEDFEKEVIEKMHSTFGIRFEKNSNPRGVDLVCGQEKTPLMTAEVKWDRRVEETGNTFIEVSGKEGRLSGLFAETGDAPSLFIIGSSLETLVFHTPSLQKLVKEWQEDKTFKLINGGDGWRSKGMLAKWDILREKAVSII